MLIKWDTNIYYMMTLRQRVFIIVSLIIGIIVVIVLFLYYRRTQNELSTVENVTGGSAQDSQQAPVNAGESKDLGPAETPVKVAEPYSEDLYVRQLSKIFVERFYSFSNQNDNGHIADSLELASPSMKTWMEAQAKEFNKEYEGVVTSVFASKLAEKTETSATVTIQTQQKWERKTTGGALTQEERRRNGKITLVKIDGKWLVDGFFWDKE